MPLIPNLFGLGLQGKSSTITAQGHINLYAEITPEGEKSRVSFIGTPGLLSYNAAFGDTPQRGMIPVGDYFYTVHRGTFWRVDNAGIRTNMGTLSTTSGRVEMASNGTQIGIVDGTNMYCFTIAGSVFATVSSGLFASPISITFQDGYFIVGFRNGRFQISASYDGTTFDALDYATAESNPDALWRVIADHGEIVLAGDETVEFWGNSGGQDFPYSNIRGATQEFGLAAPWSLVKYNDSLAGLFRNKMGQVQVMQITGHSLRPLSTQEHSALINNYSAVNDATAFSYMLGGHPMLQVNFPSAGKSWLFDQSTGLWTEMQSGLSGGRHRGEILIDYLNKPRVADYSTGDIYTLDANTYTDNGTAIPREITTRHIFMGTSKVSIPALQVDMETGVGLITGQGEDPQAMLQISKDNGHTWGAERWVTIGPIGKYLTRVIWRRLGAARDWVFKIRITDPVKVVICNAFAGDNE